MNFSAFDAIVKKVYINLISLAMQNNLFILDFSGYRNRTNGNAAFSFLKLACNKTWTELVSKI